jgi:hypothetical protein
MIEGNAKYQEAIGGLTANSTARLGPVPWADCSDADKLERLRNELDGWRRECARLRDRIQLLETHRHGEGGALLVSLEQADRQMSMNQACS